MKNGKLTKSDFVRAAKLIETKWTKGSYETRGKFCAIGALHCVTEDSTPYRMITRRRLNNLTNDCSFSYALIDYNDDSSTSKQDVQTLLLLLGEIAESR